MSPTKLLIVLLCLSALYCSSDAWWRRRRRRRKHTTTGTGRVLCRMENGRTTRPLVGIIVKLKDKDLIFHDTFGSTRSSNSGRFSITGSAKDPFGGKPDPFIEVQYNYNGAYGHMEIDGLFGRDRRYKTSKRSYSRHINFGDIVISDEHCRAYVHFYDAMKDYRMRTGQSLPYSSLKVRTRAIIHGGTPYALGKRIKIPKNCPLSLETAKHELAHTVRHALDGSLAHFLWDAGRFWYLRSHHCGSRTNHGYAFNEGFAEYWAGECRRSSYGSSATDYRIEGNVANALRNLQTSCRLSNAGMINILRRNRGKIHSFADFKKRSGCR